VAPARPRVVLVGAGHAHLHVLRNAAVLRAAGVEPVLVAPSTFHYSGLATGVLSGALTADRAQIDVAALASNFGVRHIAAEATVIDRAARRLRLSDGQDLIYDALSLNVGSVTPDPYRLTGQADVWSTKPLNSLACLKTRIESSISSGRPDPAIVIAGGGPSGFEIAAALAGLLERNAQRPRLHLVCKREAGWGPRRAISSLTTALQRRGVVLVSGEVVEREAGACRLSDGRSLACDMLVLAAGLSAAPIVTATGLPVSSEGRLQVGPTLQSVADPTVFAVGDCSVMEGAPRPAAGVFGVRAAPILLHNLAALGGGGMRRYRPQRQWLSIMDLGDGTGLAIRGRLWWMGRSALALKRRLDLGFIAAMRAPSGEVLQD
jgi:NADH dehydrogenase FAD-containing subunit